MNTQHDITAGGQTLDPPTPPRKPHRLLWIDLETTGISRTEAKILEIAAAPCPATSQPRDQRRRHA